MSHRISIILRTLYSPFIAFIVSAAIGQTHAYSIPENHAVNGGISIIPFESVQKPIVFFDNHRIPVVESTKPNQWLLIAGIPLNNTQSIQDLLINKPKRSVLPIHVSDKYYKTQYLTIEDTRKVDPLPQDHARIAVETKKLATLFSSYTAQNPFVNDFIPPAQGPVSSLFGLNRVFNKEPRPSHTGLDIAAPADANVSAISAGTVVDTGDYFYTGNTVIVDHGMGVFSLYGHLKKIDVTPGEIVKQGTLLGKVGMTGRATGPHLHWSMIVNQTYVDPLLFVPSQYFKALPKKEKQQV